MLNVKLARGVSDLATTASGAVIGGCGPDVSHLPVFGVIADAKADGDAFYFIGRGTARLSHRPSDGAPVDDGQCFSLFLWAALEFWQEQVPGDVIGQVSIAGASKKAADQENQRAGAPRAGLRG